MNSNALNDFRHGMYGCFGKVWDAPFNLVDALGSCAGARSFPELSFSPFFERTWASLYEALEDDRIDAECLREMFLQFAPLPEPGQLVFPGIGTSNLYRPEGETRKVPASMARAAATVSAATTAPAMAEPIRFAPCLDACMG